MGHAVSQPESDVQSHDATPTKEARVNCFAVVTWGAAASFWLARSLNAQPDIFCVHALNNKLARVTGQPRLGAHDYHQLLVELGRGYKLCGEVHGIDRDHAIALKAQFPQAFRCAVLVREPIRRLQSQLALLKMCDPADYSLTYVENLIDRLGLQIPDRSPWTYLQIHAVNMLNAVIDEVNVGPLFRQEDICSNADSLRALIDHLDDGAVHIDEPALNNATAQQAINTHHGEAFELDPWHEYLLRNVVRPEAWEIYQGLGYPRPRQLSNRTNRPAAAADAAPQLPSDPHNQITAFDPPLELHFGEGRGAQLCCGHEKHRQRYPEAEMATRRWMSQTVEPDWVCLDVGANVGEYTLLLSSLAIRGHVYAFEPTRTIELLRRNVAHNRLPANHTLLQQAMGYEPERQVCDFNTIDHFVTRSQLGRVDLIKIDTDSYDFEVLQGAEETLVIHDPWVVVELNHALHDRDQTVEMVLSWLSSRSYQRAMVLDGENYVTRRRWPTDGPMIEGVIELPSS